MFFQVLSPEETTDLAGLNDPIDSSWSEVSHSICLTKGYIVMISSPIPLPINNPNFPVCFLSQSL